MTHQLKLTPRDPLVTRDGRPFGTGQGTRMRSLDWFYPSVVAGSLRALLGKESGLGFEHKATLDALKRTEIAGPFPVIDGKLYLPRPTDVVIREKAGQRRAFGVRPMRLAEGAGCDLPAGLNPVMLPDSCQDDFKPVRGPAFWSLSNLAEWLSHAGGEGFELSTTTSSGYQRVHDAERRATLSRSQQFAERAFQQVQQRQTGSKNEREKQKYASYAKRFPSLIHSCGLAQAVAFAQGKAPKHFRDDLRAAMNSGHQSGEQFAQEVRSADLMNYLRLSRQALEAAGWLKRYAEALLED